MRELRLMDLRDLLRQAVAGEVPGLGPSAPKPDQPQTAVPAAEAAPPRALPARALPAKAAADQDAPPPLPPDEQVAQLRGIRARMAAAANAAKVAAGVSLEAEAPAATKAPVEPAVPSEAIAPITPAPTLAASVERPPVQRAATEVAAAEVAAAEMLAAKVTRAEPVSAQSVPSEAVAAAQSAPPAMPTEAQHPAAPSKPSRFQRLRQLFRRRESIKLPISEPTTPFSVLVATLVINLLALGLPLVIMQVYDRIIPNRSYETLTMLVLLLAGILVLDLALKSLRAWAMGWEAAHFTYTTSVKAVERLAHAPHGETEKQPLASHINRLAAIGAVGDFHGGASRLMIIDLPFMTIFLVMLALVGGVMVLVPLALFAVFGIVAVRRNRALRDVLHERVLQDNRKYDFVTEAIAGIHTVKALAMEQQMQRRFERLQQSVAEINHRTILVGGHAQSAAVLYGSVSQMIVVAIGAMMVIEGRLSMGGLACCTLLSGQVLQPLLRGISLWAEHESLDLKRRDVAELFTLPEREAGLPLDQHLKGHIRLEGVRFSHDSTGQNPVFAGLDLDVPPGTILGIRGQEGSGRSTLLRLVRGDIQPTAGRVSIDGINMSGPMGPSAREHIAYVGPQPLLFRATILDNIALFRQGVAREAAREAARLIGLDDDVHRMPEGFDTKLGDSIADDLPAAIAQRIAIARALASGPSILILDDANSVLDPRGEMCLKRALDALRGRMTVLVVSHRPSFLASADIIVTLKGGRIVPEDVPVSVPVTQSSSA